jgi:hypothetical protein
VFSVKLYIRLDGNITNSPSLISKIKGSSLKYILIWVDLGLTLTP